MKPQKLGFERKYSDGFGVEIGVYFDELQMGNDGGPLVEIQSIDRIAVSFEHLDFLIESLRAVRENWEEPR